VAGAVAAAAKLVQCCSVIVADESHDLAGQIVDGAEDTARDYLAFNFREPNLYLIEPGGVGRGVVNT
jgi:hypothetical protein